MLDVPEGLYGNQEAIRQHLEPFKDRLLMQVRQDRNAYIASLCWGLCGKIGAAFVRGWSAYWARVAEQTGAELSKVPPEERAAAIAAMMPMM